MKAYKSVSLDHCPGTILQGGQQKSVKGRCVDIFHSSPIGIARLHFP